MELFALCLPTVLVTDNAWEMKEDFCFLSSKLTKSTHFDSSTLVFHSRNIPSSKKPLLSLHTSISNTCRRI